MNEAQRQAALRQMGIQSWFPRFVLPGAAPSRQAEVSAEMFGIRPEKNPVHPAELFEQERSPAQSRERLDSALQSAPIDINKQAGSSPSPTPPVKSVSAAPAQHANTEESLKLQIQLIILSDGLVLLNEMPAAGNGRLSARHQRLLQQIGLASARSGEGNAIGNHLFKWPLLDIPGMDTSAEAARGALLAFMEEHLQGKAPKHLVIMGELLASKVFSVSAGLPARHCVTWNLDQMLNLPALKKDVWLALRQSAGGQ